MKDRAFGVIPIYKTETEPLFLVIHQQKGHWAFPKGHREGDETDLEAAQREFEEETGIREYRVQPEPTFQEHYVYQQDGELIDKTVTFFIAWVGTQKVTHQQAEIQDFRWFPYREALAAMTFKGGKNVLRQVWRYLRQSEVADLNEFETEEST